MNFNVNLTTDLYYAMGILVPRDSIYWFDSWGNVGQFSYMEGSPNTALALDLWMAYLRGRTVDYILEQAYENQTAGTESLPELVKRVFPQWPDENNHIFLVRMNEEDKEVLENRKLPQASQQRKLRGKSGERLLPLMVSKSPDYYAQWVEFVPIFGSILDNTSQLDEYLAQSSPSPHVTTISIVEWVRNAMRKKYLPVKEDGPKPDRRAAVEATKEAMGDV